MKQINLIYSYIRSNKNYYHLTLQMVSHPFDPAMLFWQWMCPQRNRSSLMETPSGLRKTVTLKFSVSPVEGNQQLRSVSSFRHFFSFCKQGCMLWICLHVFKLSCWRFLGWKYFDHGRYTLLGNYNYFIFFKVSSSFTQFRKV